MLLRRLHHGGHKCLSELVGCNRVQVSDSGAQLSLIVLLFTVHAALSLAVALAGEDDFFFFPGSDSVSETRSS